MTELAHVQCRSAINNILEVGLRLTTVFFTFLLLNISIQVTLASRQSHVVVVVAASTSINDVTSKDLPNIAHYLSRSSVGILSIRTGRPLHDSDPFFVPIAEPNCITAGAGAPALADQNARFAANAVSNVSSMDFNARTGIRPSLSNVLAICAPEITALNALGSYQAHPGLLGDMLHSKGLKTAIIGNSDALNEQHRESVYIASDGHGIVDYGDVSSKKLTIPSIQHSFGVRANIEYIRDRTQMEMRRSSLIVIDCGDTLRADMYAILCMEKQLPLLRHSALTNLDKLIGRLTRIIGPDDYLIVMSPNVALNPPAFGQQVGWMAISGKEYTKGLLSSPSTRRQGVVVLTDFAPTVLTALSIAIPREMTGRSILSVKSKQTGNLLYLQKLDRQAVIESQRMLVMRGSSVVIAVVIALVTLVFLLRSKNSRRICGVWCAAVMTTLPTSLIIAPVIWNTGALGTALTVILLVAMQAVMGIRFLKTPRKLIVVSCLMTVVIIGYDLLTGYALMRSSPAGYSIAESARFYGIGNELMGVILGCALIVSALVWNKYQISLLKQIIVSTVFLVTLFIFIGSPNLGANVGGALATMPAVLVFILTLRGKPPTIKGALLAISITIAAVAFIFLLDYLRGATHQTHAARMLSLLQTDGTGEATQIVLRKLQVNLILIVSSLWSRLLFVSILCVALLAAYLRRSSGRLFESRYEKAGFSSLVIATAGALIFNDSGVVAAATCSIYLWVLVILRVSENKNLGDEVT